MKKISYAEYVQAECERQWNECQAEEHGKWHEQANDTKSEYYNDRYSNYDVCYDSIGSQCCFSFTFLLFFSQRDKFIK